MFAFHNSLQLWVAVDGSHLFFHFAYFLATEMELLLFADDLIRSR